MRSRILPVNAGIRELSTKAGAKVTATMVARGRVERQKDGKGYKEYETGGALSTQIAAPPLRDGGPRIRRDGTFESRLVGPTPTSWRRNIEIMRASCTRKDPDCQRRRPAAQSKERYEAPVSCRASRVSPGQQDCRFRSDPRPPGSAAPAAGAVADAADPLAPTIAPPEAPQRLWPPAGCVRTSSPCRVPPPRRTGRAARDRRRRIDSPIFKKKPAQIVSASPGKRAH